MDQLAQPKRTWSRNPRHPLALLHVRKGSRRSLPELGAVARSPFVEKTQKNDGKLGIIRNTGDEYLRTAGRKKS
jgi:hypothetical protein